MIAVNLMVVVAVNITAGVTTKASEKNVTVNLKDANREFATTKFRWVIQNLRNHQT